MNESESRQARNESSTDQAERDFAHRQRMGLGLSLVLIPTVVFFSFFIFKAVNQVHSFAISSPLLFVLGLFDLLFLSFPVILLHRKWTTGRFTVTRAEARAKQEAAWSKLGAGKPLGPQLGFAILPIILISMFAAIAIVPIYFLRNTSGQPPRFLLVLIAVFFVAIVAVPAWLLFKFIRRKLKTGSFLPSQEEIAKVRARTRKPVTAGTGILTASSMWMVAGTMAAMQINAYRHLRTPEMYMWGVVALCLGASCLWIWQVFRPSKPLCAVPDEEQDPQEQPMKVGKRAALLALGLAVASILPAFTIFSTPRYRVIYPAATEARADLASALQSATQSHKRVLVEFGANSDGDSQRLDRYFQDKNNLSLLHAGFIPVFVNTDAHNSGYCACDANKDLAGQYAISFDKGIPALAVLSEKGELIYSQRNGEFADMRHLKSSDLTAFLLRWEPTTEGSRSTP
jgi:hypothetical protein